MRIEHGAACDWMAVRGAGVVCRGAGSDLLGLPDCSARVYSGRRPGLHHVHRPSAAGSVADVHAGHLREGGEVLSHVPEISGAFTVAGFSQAGNAPNRADYLREPEAFRGAQRRAAHAPRQLFSDCAGRLFGIPGALVVPFNPPAVQGLGQFGGFQFELEDLGRNSLQTIANTANTLVAQGNAGKELTGLVHAALRQTIRNIWCASIARRRRACRCRSAR